MHFYAPNESSGPLAVFLFRCVLSDKTHRKTVWDVYLANKIKEHASHTRALKCRRDGAQTTSEGARTYLHYSSNLLGRECQGPSQANWLGLACQGVVRACEYRGVADLVAQPFRAFPPI